MILELSMNPSDSADQKLQPSAKRLFKKSFGDFLKWPQLVKFGLLNSNFKTNKWCKGSWSMVHGSMYRSYGPT